MTNEFNQIEKKLINVINNFLKDADEQNLIGNRVWTNGLKVRIGELGIKEGFEVATGGFRDVFEREWLYDIVWYLTDDQKRLVRIPLIVESEWDINYQGIKYDFEKLLVGNAEHRLMICQSKFENVEGLFAKFKEAINVFEENYGDRFLIAILDSQTESEFYYKTYTKPNKR